MSHILIRIIKHQTALSHKANYRTESSALRLTFLPGPPVRSGPKRPVRFSGSLVLIHNCVPLTKMTTTAAAPHFHAISRGKI